MSLSCEVSMKPYFRMLLADSKEDLICPVCHKAFSGDVIYCPILKKAWCRECFLDAVPINHFGFWNGKRQEHEDLKVDSFKVKGIHIGALAFVLLLFGWLLTQYRKVVS